MLILKEGVRSVKNACLSARPDNPTALTPSSLLCPGHLLPGTTRGMPMLRARDSVAGFPVGGIWGLLRKEDVVLGGCGSGQGPAQRAPLCLAPHLHGSSL